MIVAGHRTGPATHRGLDAGPPVRSTLVTNSGKHCRRITDTITRFFNDQGKASAKVLTRWQHRPGPRGEGPTRIVEAINCSLRRRCGVLVRKSCSFSKSLTIHTVRTKIVIDNHNLPL